MAKEVQVTVPEEVLTRVANFAALEAAKSIEQRLQVTLVRQIEQSLNPLNVSEIQHLKSEVGYLNSVMKEATRSMFGLWLIKRAVNRVQKTIDKTGQHNATA
jgi:hypothetical protein